MNSLDKYVVMSTIKNKSVASYLKNIAVPAAPEPTIWEALTPGGLAAAMSFGASPDNMYKGADASGVLDLAGSVDLSDTGSPLHLVDDADLDALTVELNDPAQALNGGDNLDVGVGSWAELVVGKFIGAQGAGTGIVGKRATAGFELVMFGASGGLQLIVDPGAGIVARTLASDHVSANAGRFLALIVNDTVADTLTLHTNLGNAAGVANVANLDNTQNYTYGASGFRTSANYRFALGAHWGVSAVGMNASHLAALQTYLGL